MKTDKPHILAQAAETKFVRFEKQLPFKFEIKYQRFNVREGLLG
jgi:hypothetical protein